MNNHKELKERIANAKQELAAMETLLNESEWKSDDIYSGLQVEGQVCGKISRVVVIRTFYDYQRNSHMYMLYGNGSLFAAYGDEPRTPGEMAEYFNTGDKKKVDDVHSNFCSDGTF